jgi:gluconate 5-dehydrogenase
MPSLRGKTVFITGASRGIGKAIGLAAAREGANVVVAAKSDVPNPKLPGTIQGAAEEIERAGGKALAVRCDVRDDAEIAAAVSAAVARFGRIDVLVSNAGMTLRRPLEQFTLAEWRGLLDTNLTSAFLVARAVAPQMIERRAGKIVTVCSVMSELARPTVGAYAATKGGLKMLTRSMCADWARFNIQANAIGPGYFRTELNEPLWTNPTFDEWLRKRVPAGRWGEPDELGGAVVFLASTASAYVNGQILYVDGGMTAVV